MPRTAAAFAFILVAIFAALPASAQDRPDSEATAADMIETAQETYRAPGVRRRCPTATAGEIVVCAPDPDAFRVESPTDEAIRTGERPKDRIPQAPDLFGLPPCESYQFCSKVGRTPPPIYLIDLEAIPEPLTPDEAAHVTRVAGPPTPAAASPEAAR